MQMLYQFSALEVALVPPLVCLFHQTLSYSIDWMLFS